MKIPKISSATIIYKKIAIFIPYMQWNRNLNGWRIFFPVTGHGIRHEHLILVSLVKIAFKQLGIPLAKIMQSYCHIEQIKEYDSIKQNNYWVDSDISSKIEKHLTKEEASIKNAIDFLESDEAQVEENWPSCNKQYCEQCDPLKNYKIDDVRTLRKNKSLIHELLEMGIEKITDIPPEMIPNNSIINRQINSVYKNKPILIHNELEDFVKHLAYPRYYLDFEAFSTSIPYDHNHQKIKKIWGYTPFLFSVQWQDSKEDKIHTHLWSMMPAKNQVSLMWKELKTHLLKAGSIVVYGSQFETDMLRLLSNIHSEKSIGSSILEKIVDLQAVFFDLSIYHPQQKGKISLKTITPIWIKGDYENFKVNEGIAANYYFTAMTDNKLNLFDDILDSPYIAQMYSHIQSIEDTSITINDIVQYCKYDTEVMIKIISKIENYLLSKK